MLCYNLWGGCGSNAKNSALENKKVMKNGFIACKEPPKGETEKNTCILVLFQKARHMTSLGKAIRDQFIW